MYYLPAIIAATIWAYVVSIYKKIQLESTILNLWRLSITALSISILAIPGLLNLNQAVIWAILNGIIVLGIGDTLYIKGLKLCGVSIATPIVFTYIIIVQLIATFLGEPLTISKVLASILAFLGIYILSRGGDKDVEKAKNLTLGIIYSIIASLAWAFGQSLLKLAVLNIDVITITFIRASSGAVTLLFITLITGKDFEKPSRKDFTKLLFYSPIDLGLGAYLFILSISLIGLGLTVILISLTPLLAQIIAHYLCDEKIGVKELMSAILIISGITMCVLNIL